MLQILYPREMRNKIVYTFMSLLAAFIFSAGLLAQEKTELSIQVKKDGKVVKDTTYQFDDAADAKHVVKMVELMSGMDADMEKGQYNYTMAHKDGKQANTMVFISRDGEKTEIKEMLGDSLVWVSEGEDGEHVKVMKYKMNEGEDPHMEHMHGENVVVMKKGDGETFDIWVEKDGEEAIKGKRVKVVVSGDEKGNWTVVSSDEADLDENENVFVVSGDDDVHVEVREIIEKTGDGENVKVIVIKKEIDEDSDHDAEHDKDLDEDVDVKVVKKKIKVEKK